MIIYNVTANIEDSIHDEWLVVDQTTHSKSTGNRIFLKATFTKVLVEESMGGLTYSIQYLAHSKEALESYTNSMQPIFKRKDLQKIWR